MINSIQFKSNSSEAAHPPAVVLPASFLHFPEALARVFRAGWRWHLLRLEHVRAHDVGVSLRRLVLHHARPVAVAGRRDPLRLPLLLPLALISGGGVHESVLGGAQSGVFHLLLPLTALLVEGAFLLEFGASLQDLGVACESKTREALTNYR